MSEDIYTVRLHHWRGESIIREVVGPTWTCTRPERAQEASVASGADAVESLQKWLNGILGSIHQQQTDGLYLLKVRFS